MATMTWKQLRKVLVDCGDDDCMDREANIRMDEGEGAVELVVSAVDGGLALILAVDGE